VDSLSSPVIYVVHLTISNFFIIIIIIIIIIVIII